MNLPGGGRVVMISVACGWSCENISNKFVALNRSGCNAGMVMQFVTMVRGSKRWDNGEP